jgi:hypothetical protein
MVNPTANSHNLITDNQFVALTGSKISLLTYDGGTNTTDVVAHNSFTDTTGDVAQLLVTDHAQGLTVESNTFTDNGANNAIAIQVDPTVQNLKILDNIISLTNNTFAVGIQVTASTTVSNTSVVIANNHIHTGGTGVGIQFAGEQPGSTLVASVEDNDLQGNQNGVFIDQGQGGSVAGIDLGGGAQGSKGANDFRGDASAIFVFAQAAQGTIQAQMNIFGVADPTTVIHDHHIDSSLANVVATNPLTGNAAYVETLYLDFLHRTGDLNPSHNDAAGWVTLLMQGAPAAVVSTGVAKSLEGLGALVDGLYHRFLGRDADPIGRANFIGWLQKGATLEGVIEAMLTSTEYQSHFHDNTDFVQSLFQSLLHRTGDTTEVNNWLTQLAQSGRSGVAQGFLTSLEYRDDEVGDDYGQLLHRTPSAAEVNLWATSALDILSIDALMAASPEFQLNA